MKYIVSILLMCVMAAPAVSQRKAWVKSPPQKHQSVEKSQNKEHNVPIACGTKDGQCGVKDCKCACHKKDSSKKTDKKDSRKKTDKKDSRRGKGSRGDSRRGKGSRGFGGRSRRSRSSRRIDAEYESKLRARLKSAVSSGRLKKEQAAKLLKDRFGATKKKEAKNDTDKRRQWLNINSNERKKWGEILNRRLQGNRYFTKNNK